MKIRDKMNPKYTQLALYVIITAVIIYCLSLVANNAPAILHVVWEKASWLLTVVKPVVIGFVIAYLMEPVVSFFENKYKKLKFFTRKEKRCRTLAVFTSILLAFLLLAAIVSLLVFSVTDQIKIADFDDIISVGNAYLNNFRDFYQSVLERLNSMDIRSAELEKYVREASSYIVQFLQGVATKAVTSATNISGYLTTAIFSIIIGIYFLIDGKMIMNYVSRVFYALFNVKFNRRLRGLLNDADTVFSGYISGQLTDAILMMFLISITLSLVGVKLSIVIGILAGIGNLIPYFGPFVAYAGTILVCIVNGQYKQMILGVIFLFIIQSIDGNIIGPKLLSKSISIHPLLVIISLIFGSSIGGLFGMLLAVPAGAFLKVIFVRFIEHRLSVRKSRGELDPEIDRIDIQEEEITE